MKLAEHQVMQTNTPTVLIGGVVIGTPAEETIVLPASVLLLEQMPLRDAIAPGVWVDLLMNGETRTPETEYLFACLDTLMNPSLFVRAPTPEQPYTEFNCAICETGVPYLLPRVRSVSLSPVHANRFSCEVTCTYTPNPAHYPASPWFRRYVWKLGEAQPEVIALLGLEVRS